MDDERNGKKVDQRLRKTTKPRKTKSKTNGTKWKGAGNGTARIMGAKSSSGKGPRKTGSDSMQLGIKQFFGKGTSSVEAGTPRGLRKSLQIPAAKEWKSSVMLRPSIELFMTRDLPIKSETG